VPVTTTLRSNRPTGFCHQAFFYDSPSQFYAGVVPFVDAAVATGEPVLVILPGPKLDEVRRRVAAVDRVELADMDDVGGNPGRIIPLWLDFVDRHRETATSLRGVGEPIGPHRSGEELAECQVHETLLNVAFADSIPWRLLCPYDESRLPADTIDEARRSHPYVGGADGHRQVSADYLGTGAAGGVLTRPLPPPPPDALDVPFAAETLPHVRRLVGAESVRRGLPAARAGDLELAVGEAGANSLLHGGGGGRMKLWSDDDHLVAEVSDRGQFSELLAGRVRPPVDQLGGRGLWIVQQVCDLVQVRSTGHGTTVRMHMRRPDRPPS
jgi:anti-sigma regulatory factor (Ser/Thr protein kinase)